MSSVAMIFMLICGAVLQAVIPTGAVLGEARVPVLQGLVIYYALTRRRSEALRVAVLAGFFHDALCMIPLGYSSFVLCCCAWVINKVRDEVFIEDWTTHLLFGALANGIVTLFLYVLLTQGGGLVMGLNALFLKCMGSVVMGAVVVPFVFRIATSLDRALGLIPMRESI